MWRIGFEKSIQNMEEEADSIRALLEYWFSHSCVLDFILRPRQNLLLTYTTCYVYIETITFVIEGKGTGKWMLTPFQVEIRTGSWSCVKTQKSGISSILGSRLLKPETLTLLYWRANIDIGASFVFINRLGNGRLFSSKLYLFSLNFSPLAW